MPRPPAKIDWGPAGRIPILGFTAAIPRGPDKPVAGDGRGKLRGCNRRGGFGVGVVADGAARVGE